jgi:O-antigen ligase
LERIEITITFITICCVSLSLLFPGPRHWFQSIKRKPFAAFLIVLSIAAVFLGSQRGTRAIVENPVDTVRVFRIIVLLFVGIPALIFTALGKKRAGASGSLFWMALYALLAMFSASYSKLPLLSLYKGFEVAVFVALGLYVGTILHSWQDVEDIVNILLLVMWYLIISALIGAVMAPSLAWGWGESGDSMSFTMSGVFPVINANTLTQLGGIVACVSLCRLFRDSKGPKKMAELLIFFTAVICMVLSHSRTSLFAFIPAIGLVLISYQKKKIALVAVALGGLGSLFFALSDYVVSYFLRGQTAAGFSSMSGRTYFWPLVTNWVEEAPLWGHGFYASQRVLFGVSSVDQAYLEVLLGLGMIGLTIFCLAVLRVMLNLWKSRPPAKSRSRLSEHVFLWTQVTVIFIFIFLRSLTGPSFQLLHINLTLFVLVTVCAAAMVKLKKAEQGAPAEMAAAVSSFLPSRTEPKTATLFEQAGRAYQKGG